MISRFILWMHEQQSRPVLISKRRQERLMKALINDLGLCKGQAVRGSIHITLCFSVLISLRFPSFHYLMNFFNQSRDLSGEILTM